MSKIKEQFNVEEGKVVETVDFREEYPRFTPEMKSTHKILIPDMLPTHFAILSQVLNQNEFDTEVLHNSSRNVIDEGLKHVHNDTCFPALCVCGQFIDALKSGKYDLEHTAVIVPQTGGGCRASNYLSLIRKALKTEFPSVPVVSLNFSGFEKDSSLPFTLGLLLKLAYAVSYGDLIVSLYNQCKPYEKNIGESESVRKKCIDNIVEACKSSDYRKFKKHVKFIAQAYAEIPLNKVKKTKVAIVGEIYIKYSPLGNNDLEKFLLSENCEVKSPFLLDFVMYCIVNIINDNSFFGYKVKGLIVYKILYAILRKMERDKNKIILKYTDFNKLHDFQEVRKLADKVINQKVKMGEGWLIGAEMAINIESGINNIVCAQPFGCLPNHIVAKGISRKIKEMYPKANIVAVDYDPSATRVNQENRIKLMLTTAKENEKK